MFRKINSYNWKVYLSSFTEFVFCSSNKWNIFPKDLSIKIKIYNKINLFLVFFCYYLF
jgi:hypothetical protein